MIDHGLRRKWAKAASQHFATTHRLEVRHHDQEPFEDFIERRIDPKISKIPDVTLTSLSTKPVSMQILNVLLDGVYNEEAKESGSANKTTATQKIVTSLKATLSPNLS